MILELLSRLKRYIYGKQISISVSGLCQMIIINSNEIEAFLKFYIFDTFQSCVSIDFLSCQIRFQVCWYQNIELDCHSACVFDQNWTIKWWQLKCFWMKCLNVFVRVDVETEAGGWLWRRSDGGSDRSNIWNINHSLTKPRWYPVISSFHNISNICFNLQHFQKGLWNCSTFMVASYFFCTQIIGV